MKKFFGSLIVCLFAVAGCFDQNGGNPNENFWVGWDCPAFELEHCTTDFDCELSGQMCAQDMIWLEEKCGITMQVCIDRCWVDKKTGYDSCSRKPSYPTLECNTKKNICEESEEPDVVSEDVVETTVEDAVMPCDGSCPRQCENDYDCADGQQCTEYMCVWEEGRCAYPSDCDDGQICQEGQCQTVN